MIGSPVEFFLLNERTTFDYLDRDQPRFNSVLVHYHKWFRNQVLFELADKKKDTHVAIHKDHLKHKNISIRIPHGLGHPTLMIVYRDDTFERVGNQNDIGIIIKFNWEYIEYFRDKYVDAVKHYIKHNRDLLDTYEFKKRMDTLTENLTDLERLYLEI